MLTRDQIIAILEDKTESELVALHNNWCRECNHPQDYIYENTEENLLELIPSDPLRAFQTGRSTHDQYSPTDEYLQLDGYDNPKTASNPVNCLLYLYDLAKWLETDSYLQYIYLDIEEEEEESEDDDE